MTTTRTHRPHVAPPPRRPSRRARALALAAVAVPLGTPLALAPPVSAASFSTDFDYACSSAIGSSPTEYTIEAEVPDEVVAGEPFDLSPVVLSGTAPVDLLLVQLTFEVDDPDGADATDGLSRQFFGPGSTNPPGPIAPEGSYNSTPEMTFGFVATGEVGSTIEFYSSTVSSTAAEIGNPSNTLDVACERVSEKPFATTTIVAPPPPSTTTTTTSTSTTTQPEADVLGIQAAAPAQPVVAAANLTG